MLVVARGIGYLKIEGAFFSRVHSESEDAGVVHRCLRVGTGSRRLEPTGFLQGFKPKLRHELLPF